MVKSKTIRLDPKGINRIMDVGGPSTLNTALKKHRKEYKNKSEKCKPTEKSVKLTKRPKQALRPQ
jgi:hypothetical protein